MTDVKRPSKFYPYYKVAFLTDGADKGTSYFSYPDNLDDDNAFGALAANIELAKNEQGMLGCVTMRLYNMSADHRSALFREPYYVQPGDTTDSFQRIWLQLGYLSYDNGQRWLNWNGDIMSAYSYKQGDNIVTEIIAYQKGYLLGNAFIQLQIERGKTLKDIIETQFSQVIKDADYTKEIRQKAEKAAGKNAAVFFIDNEKFDVDLKDNFKFEKPRELNDTITNALGALLSYAPNARISLKGNDWYITDSVKTGEPDFIINAESGLQSTPKIMGQRITLSTMFEPEIDIASRVRVESLIEPNINGDYSVMGYTHSLTLGEGTRASAVTNLNLLMQGIEG